MSIGKVFFFVGTVCVSSNRRTTRGAIVFRAQIILFLFCCASSRRLYSPPRQQCIPHGWHKPKNSKSSRQMKNSDAIHTITREHRGHTITVNWFADYDHGTPWENEDGHGPVTEWECRDKRPGERVLSSDRSAKRFYDYAEAIKLAKRDGWDAKPYGTGTAGERAARAVESDFARLQAWCEDRWHYVGFTCEIEGFAAYHDSCWGFESDFMAEPTSEAISAAVAFLDLEIVEAQDAACRDLITA